MKAMHTHFWKTMFKDMVSFQMESASTYRKQKFTKQREGKEKLEVRPSRVKGASLGVSEHVSTACRPRLAAASHPICPPLKPKLILGWQQSSSQQARKPLCFCMPYNCATS